MTDIYQEFRQAWITAPSLVSLIPANRIFIGGSGSTTYPYLLITDSGSSKVGASNKAQYDELMVQLAYRSNSQGQILVIKEVVELVFKEGFKFPEPPPGGSYLIISVHPDISNWTAEGGGIYMGFNRFLCRIQKNR